MIPIQSIQYSTIQYNTDTIPIQYRCNTMQYDQSNAIRCNTDTMHYNTVQYNTDTTRSLHYTTLHYTTIKCNTDTTLIQYDTDTIRY